MHSLGGILWTLNYIQDEVIEIVTAEIDEYYSITRLIYVPTDIIIYYLIHLSTLGENKCYLYLSIYPS